jgi:hypothetical protein
VNGQTMLGVTTSSGTSSVALSAVTSVAANPNNPLSGLLGS